MKQCFISHCSEDLKTIVEPLDELLSSHYSENDYQFFCSSTTRNSLDPGQEVIDLKNKLRDSTCLIAIVTDNFLRSSICLAELSAMWFASDNHGVIPIAYSDEGKKYLREDFISNLIYLDATDASYAERNAKLLISALEKKEFYPINRESLQKSLIVFFRKSRQQMSQRPYIGSGEVYRNINSYCERNGIKQVTSGVVSDSAVKKQLSTKKDIYLVMTTGSSFIETYAKEFFQEQLAKGVNIYLVIPNRNSDFCRDLAEIESPENAQSNLNRITSEFDNVINKLKYVIQEAATKANVIGHVYICAAYTLLRQTICIGKDDSGQCWGWMTTTLPPIRAAGNTPTIIFEGNLNDEFFLGKAVYQHVGKMIEIAHERNGVVDLASEMDFTEFSRDTIIDQGERKEIEKRWEQRYSKAKSLMEKRKHLSNCILIEIAAQHPLVEGKPGAEFRARLDYGFHLYKDFLQEGKSVSIYVPGSVHMENGIVDSVSLSEAGCSYLLEKGVPEECLFGEKENAEYMGDDGVYNSCDECFVSSNIFIERGFGVLHCVCSPNQMMRKQLFYLQFNIIPIIHTVNCTKMYHKFTQELFHSIPAVIYKYPNWSDRDCPMFRSSREDRKPGYKSE